MILFYTDNINGELAQLTEEEARHCNQVLRKKAGDQIQFVDGKGGFYTGEIQEIKKKFCEVKIIEKHLNYNQPDFKLHIAIAPTKNINRLEWFLEKSTEIGIDTVSPILCFHSERKNIRVDRLNRIMAAAMKQSVKAYLPVLNELVSFADFLICIDGYNGQRFIAHCDQPTDHLKSLYTKGADALVLIGPEGDFSKEEVEMAMDAGFKEISLGKARLRTETAGVVACHTVNLVNE